MRRWLAPGALLAALLAAWQVAASNGAIAEALSLEPFLVPSPAEVAESLWESRSLIADDTWVTLQEILLGFALGLLAGAGFAVAMRLSDTLRQAAYPLIVASQTIPIVVFAPILVVWFGYGIEPKVLIVALLCFFPITVNTLAGLRSVDPEAVKMMRTLEASRLQILRRLEAPGALPQLFTGMRIAATFAPIGAVFGEWSGSSAGLGHLVQQDLAQLETARMFAAAAVLAAIALAMVGLIALAERRVVDWR